MGETDAIRNYSVGKTSSLQMCTNGCKAAETSTANNTTIQRRNLKGQFISGAILIMFVGIDFSRLCSDGTSPSYYIYYSMWAI